MPAGKSPVQALTFSALMAAIAVTLYLIASLVPILGSLARLVVGLPIVFAVVKTRSESSSLIGSLIATLIISLFFGPIAGIQFAGVYILPALVMGSFLLRASSLAWTIGASLIAALLGNALYYAAAFMISGMDLVSITESTYAMKDEIIAMYEESGLLDNLEQQSLGARAEFLAMIDRIFRYLILLIPSMLTVLIAFQIGVQYIVALGILRRDGFPAAKLKPFRTWHISAPFAIPFLLAWALFLLRENLPWTWLEPVVLNVLLLGGILAAVNGLAYSIDRLQPERFNFWAKLLTVLLIVMFFNGFLIFIALVGLFDMLIDLREREKIKKE